MPSSSAIAKAVDAQHHDYSWTDSHISLLVVVGWLLAAAIVAVVVMLRFETVPPFERQIVLWVVLLLLVSIGMWGQRNSNRRLRSVDVVSDGLWFGGVNQRNSDFCSWASIERVERFSYPDHTEY